MGKETRIKYLADENGFRSETAVVSGGTKAPTSTKVGNDPEEFSDVTSTAVFGDAQHDPPRGKPHKGQKRPNKRPNKKGHDEVDIQSDVMGDTTSSEPARDTPTRDTPAKATLAKATPAKETAATGTTENPFASITIPHYDNYVHQDHQTGAVAVLRDPQADEKPFYTYSGMLSYA